MYVWSVVDQNDWLVNPGGLPIKEKFSKMIDGRHQLMTSEPLHCASQSIESKCVESKCVQQLIWVLTFI